LELDSETTAPPLPAGEVRLTVPVADWPLTTALGLIDMLARLVGGLMVSGNVALTPRYEAVSVTGVGALTTPATTGKVPEPAPCGIVSVDGTLAAAGEDDARPIVTPPLPARPVKVTEQVEPDGAANDIGLHESPLRAGDCTIVNEAPVADAGIEFPSESAASVVTTSTADEVLVVEFASCTDTVATIPSEIGVEFIPQMTHFGTPPVVLQESDLPAAAAAGPAATTADEISPAE
jgi:hypothetical protein